jgi:hypothetical protein
MAFYILGRIRNVFLSLHQQTESAPPTRLPPFTGDQDDILYDPFLYPLCNVHGNHPNSTAHIHDDDAFIPHGPSNTAPILASSPDTPTVPAHASIRIDETLTTAPLLDKNMPLPVSLQRVHQTTPETDRIPSSSPSLNPITTVATHRRIDTSTRTMRLSPPGPSATISSPTPKALTSSPDPIAVEHILVGYAGSDVVDVMSTPPTPDLDDMHKGLLLSLDSLVTGSDHASSPEPHASMVAPATRGLSRPQLSSHLDPADPAAEGEGRAEAVLREKTQTLHPS